MCAKNAITGNGAAEIVGCAICTKKAITCDGSYVTTNLSNKNASTDDGARVAGVAGVAAKNTTTGNGAASVVFGT